MDKDQDFEKSLKEIFDLADSDKDGLITSVEASGILKDFGINDELKLLFDSISKNLDQQITFKDLLLLIQQKIAKKADTFEITRMKENILNEQKSKEEEQQNIPLDTHSFSLNIGDIGTEFKTNLSVKAFAGSRAEEQFGKLTANVPAQNKYGAFLFIKCKDPIKAQESLKHLIPRLFVWINDELPAKSGLDFRQVTHTTIIEGDILKIWFELKNTNINELVEDYIKMQSRIIPAELIGFADLNLRFKKDIDDILEEHFSTNQNIVKKDMIGHIFEGLFFDVNAKMSSGVLGKLRNYYLKSKKFLELPENVRNMAFLLLWKSTKFRISFKKFTASFLDQYFAKDPSYSVGNILKKLKGIFNDFQKKHPIFKPLALIAHQEFIADMQFGLKLPHILTTVEFKSKGFQQFYDYTCSEN